MFDLWNGHAWVYLGCFKSYGLVVFALLKSFFAYFSVGFQNFSPASLRIIAGWGRPCPAKRVLSHLAVHINIPGGIYRKNIKISVLTLSLGPDYLYFPCSLFWLNRIMTALYLLVAIRALGALLLSVASHCSAPKDNVLHRAVKPTHLSMVMCRGARLLFLLARSQ